MNKRNCFIVLLLALLVFGLYFNIIYNAPTNWDDPGLIRDPGRYALTCNNLQRVFTITAFGTFQPIRDLSYMVDYTLAPDKPIFAMHIHSMVLYLFMIIATWMFLRVLFRAFSVEENTAYAWATVAAVLFAAHPVHVESVTWLYARKEPLFGLFTMLSLWAFIKASISPVPLSPHSRAGDATVSIEVVDPSRIKARPTGRQGMTGGVYYLLSFIFLILAVLSKPTALVIPAIMLVLDIALYFHRPHTGYWNKRGVFFLAALLLVIPFTLWLVKMMHMAGGVKEYHGGTFWANLLAVSQVFIEYISLYSLTVYYAADYTIRLYTRIDQWQAWAYLALNVLLIGTAVFSLMKRRYILPIFVAWHYILVAPVSHIFPIYQTLTDRYAMLPSLSWCVLLGYMIVRLWRMRLKSGFFSANFPALLAGAVFCVILSAYSFMSVRQTFIWRNAQTLWENTLNRYPFSNAANVNLASIYIGMGRLTEARELCMNALLAIPDDYNALSNLGLAQMMMQEYEKAIHNYEIALFYKPDLINALEGLFLCHVWKGDYKKAYTFFNKHLFDPDPNQNRWGAQIYSGQAWAAWRLGKRHEAHMYIQKANAVAKANPRTYRDIALVAHSMGYTTLALQSYEKLMPFLKDPTEKSDILARIQRIRR